jgi:hypothetical protein
MAKKSYITGTENDIVAMLAVVNRLSAAIACDESLEDNADCWGTLALNMFILADRLTRVARFIDMARKEGCR